MEEDKKIAPWTRVNPTLEELMDNDDITKNSRPVVYYNVLGLCRRYIHKQRYSLDVLTDEEKNLLRANNKWFAILEEVEKEEPIIAPILFEKFPRLAENNLFFISILKYRIFRLPFCTYPLPFLLKQSKQKVRLLKKQKQEGVWKEYTNSKELEKLEKTITFLCNSILNIAIELKIDLQKPTWTVNLRA